MLMLYTKVQQDDSFLATVEQTVENALDAYESDRFRANANLQEFKKKHINERACLAIRFTIAFPWEVSPKHERLCCVE